MLSPVTPCKPSKWPTPVTLNVNDLVVAPHSRPRQTYTAGYIATPTWSTAYEIKMNNEIWVIRRSQLTLWQVENTATTSIPSSLLTHTYKISRHVQNPTFEGALEQSKNRSKRTRKHPRTLRANPRQVQIKKRRCQRENSSPPPRVREWSSRTKTRPSTNNDKPP